MNIFSSLYVNRSKQCNVFFFQFISIHVRNPRTHLVHGWPVYTDYEIVVLVSKVTL